RSHRHRLWNQPAARSGQIAKDCDSDSFLTHGLLLLYLDLGFWRKSWLLRLVLLATAHWMQILSRLRSVERLFRFATKIVPEAERCPRFRDNAEEELRYGGKQLHSNSAKRASARARVAGFCSCGRNDVGFGTAPCMCFRPLGHNHGDCRSCG